MSTPLAYVVANPSKPAATGTLRRHLEAELQSAGYRVRHLLTTPQSPGTRQARQALDAGAALVVVAGGDGTLRCVAGEFAGTSTPLGVLPLGTANLTARALGLPVGGRRARQRAAQVVASGTPQPVDLLQVSTRGPGGPWHPCLTVAGTGFDAYLVASTQAALKGRIGWLAYAVAALGNLGGPRRDFQLTVTPAVGAGSTPGQTEQLRARTVLLANGGHLPAGIRLLPHARLDDGTLDVAAIDVRGSLLGWADLACQVLPPHAGRYRRSGLATVRLRQGREAALRCEQPVPVQVDGDLLPSTTSLLVRLEPGALQVMRPV